MARELLEAVLNANSVCEPESEVSSAERPSVETTQAPDADTLLDLSHPGDENQTSGPEVAQPLQPPPQPAASGRPELVGGRQPLPVPNAVDIPAMEAAKLEIEAVLLAMRTRSTLSSVQDRGCATLVSMTDGNYSNQVIAVWVLSPRLLRTHAFRVPETCAMIIAEHPLLFPCQVRAGALDTIMAALKDNVEHPGIAKEGCKAIANMVSLAAENKVRSLFLTS